MLPIDHAQIFALVKREHTNVSPASSLVRLSSLTLLAALLYAILLSVSPQLHERFHPDAAKAGHECAVTLIASGKYDQGDAAPVFVAPQSITHLGKIAALTPVWVPALFLRASRFEHAPPALS